MDARKMRFHNLGRGKLLLAQALRHFGNAQRVQFAHGLASLCALPELRQVKFRFAPFWRAENRLTCGNANQTIKSAASPDSRKARRTRPIHVATPRPCSSCCISSRLRRSDAASRNKISCSAVTRRPQQSPAEKRYSQQALRLNTLGVAYLNQQRPADAQKYFERALLSAPQFAIARLNLGIALLAQQKPEDARASLLEATRLLPKDPYAWYNLGLAYKDLGDPQKGIAAFQHAAEAAPSEPDPYYFLGYLYSQQQKYPEAIAAFQNALALAPYHASAQFGLARALQRNGDLPAAREHLALFQKITTEHLGTPFGAGYGDQGKFSLAELVTGSATEAPAP